MLKKLFIIMIILALLSGGAYYYFSYIKEKTDIIPANTDTTSNPTGFKPINRNPGTTSNNSTNTSTTTATSTQPITDRTPVSLPKLRQLSTAPVAGMVVKSNATSTVVRFMDRGTGHVYEANDINEEIVKISNTTLPRIYGAYWNKNMLSMVTRYLKTDTDTITNFYAELRPTGTSTTETAFEIKGKYISENITDIAVSPIGDKIFTWSGGLGYISGFDEKGKTKIADTPITQVVLDWPETNTVTINTKASASASGFVYSIDTRNGIMKKLVGGIKGMMSKTSHDLTKTLYSSGGNTITTSVLSNKDGKLEEVIFKTLADKCVWSSLHKNEVYCAVPTEIPTGVYPDDWYKGDVQFIDQIWHLDTNTGEVHLMANILNLSKKLVDATNLTLDQKENYLYFTNKRDLTLWSVDLNQ